MATEEVLTKITLNADSSLAVYTGVPGQPGSASPNSGNQYRFVKVTGKQQCGLAVAAGGVAECGIVQNKPQYAGNAATVGTAGVSKLVAGGAISAGHRVAPDATGRGVQDDTNGKWLALSPAGGAGEVISVLKV